MPRILVLSDEEHANLQQAVATAVARSTTLCQEMEYDHLWDIIYDADEMNGDVSLSSLREKYRDRQRVT